MHVASFPGSFLKNEEWREPGNIHRKSCQLLVPGSGGTNQNAEQNHVYVTFCLLSKKNCQLENELISTDYISKVSEKQFSNVQKG